MQALCCSPRYLLLAVAVTLTFGAWSRTDDTLPSQVGKKIDHFTLKDTNNKTWALADLQDKKAVVVLFIGTQCPINNLFMPRLAELHKIYAPKGVQILAINANRHDTPQTITEHAKQYKLPFPVLHDPGNKVADQFGALRTPEVFLLDATRVIRYQGRIDDQYGIGYQRVQPTRRDLAEALDQVLAGHKVTVARTPVAGCIITRVTAPAPRAATITYAKQVSRILQNRCQECHRSGQIGPMPLTTYEDASAWAETIKEVVQEKRMPPWHADPKHGKFSNDRSLSKEDRDTLLAWIDQGCAKGDVKELPPAKEFARGWNIGKPDAVFTMPKAFTVPAKAPKSGISYQHFSVKTNFEQDMWVTAAEAKPGNYAVVHHIIVYVKGKEKFNFDEGIGSGFLVAFAPGDLGVKYPQGAAKKIPKGATLMFQMHYTPNGTEQADQSSVGLVFAKDPPKSEVRTRAITQFLFQIPPGAAHHKVTATSKFNKDAQLWSLLPHMHLRGKSFEYQLVYPDGKREVLLSVPRYDFGWQATYFLTQPKLLPAGSRIECTAYFDNSAGNPNNPDPKVPVRWGQQTWEEMMIGFIDYSYIETTKK